MHNPSVAIGDTPAATSGLCCPRFDPASWNHKEIHWHDKRFAVAHVHSVLHVPLDFSSVMHELQKCVEDAGALEKPMLRLTDENSLWGSDLYIAVTKTVPDCDMAKISGTFLTKVFEGAFNNAGVWAQEMAAYLRSRGKEMQKLYFMYTTCPRCAKAYGRNYVVLLAQIS